MPSKELLPSSTTSDFDNTHFQTLSAQVLLVKVGSHLRAEYFRKFMNGMMSVRW